MMLDLAKQILEKRYICNHCLGRQFGQVLSGFTNEERGRSIRNSLAMEYYIKPFKIDLRNFHGYNFRNKKIVPAKSRCELCNDIFSGLAKRAQEAARKLRSMEFNTFAVGSKLTDDYVKREEKLWEDIGIEYCEPLKSELNRELGKLIEKITGKKADEKKPDVMVILNLRTRDIDIEPKPLYIYGRYQKLARGIPQTKWEMYKESVEDIIAKPLMRMAKAKAHALHGMGREDIDARCLDWRPFVIEATEPKNRKLNLRLFEKLVNRSKKVKVKMLRFSDKEEVREIKDARPEKSYRALVKFSKPVEKIGRISSLRGTIQQHTPTRVMHRRANILRKRAVRLIKYKRVRGQIYEITVRGEAGLYVKELITGDNGRTKPSVSAVLDNPAKVLELDVIKIHIK